MVRSVLRRTEWQLSNHHPAPPEASAQFLTQWSLSLSMVENFILSWVPVSIPRVAPQPQGVAIVFTVHAEAVILVTLTINQEEPDCDCAWSGCGSGHCPTSGRPSDHQTHICTPSSYGTQKRPCSPASSSAARSSRPPLGSGHSTPPSEGSP